jgi:hypothetical protein
MAMFAAFQRSTSFATFSTDTVAEPDRRAATAGLFAAASRGELPGQVLSKVTGDRTDQLDAHRGERP